MNETPPRSVPLRILAGFWGLVKLVVFVFGVVLLIGLIIGFLAVRHAQMADNKPLPASYTLTLDLARAPPDAPPPDRWLRFAQPSRPNLAETIIGIEDAAHDAHVKGINIELGGGCCSLTSAEELHNALARYRTVTGKPVIARAMSFDGATGLGAYIVATAASRIELSQAGDFGVTGLALQTPFAGAALKTIGVNAQFEHIGAYKTYPQLFTRSSPSKANLAMLNNLADSLYASALAPIAGRLHQTPAQVAALLDQAPFTAQTAQAHGLIDKVLPLNARIDGFPGHLASMQRFIEAHPHHAGTKIALIIAKGDIEAPSAEGAVGSIEPRRLDGELRHAIDDDAVKAIVLRLDTPGGTVTGSAMIGAEVAAAAAHKPLIISMGAYDASGGYWISSHGAKLIADPATLTGSIGVLGGKLSFGGLIKKIGVSVTTITRGANAGLDSPVNTWTPPQLAGLMAMLQADYQDFTGWVAQGRHMTQAEVDAVGQGRVWTGIQAKKRGLVDETGGYHTAFATVRSVLHLPVHAPLDIVNGNGNLSLHDVISQAFAKANPLGRAVLPPGLRVTGLRAADLHAILALAHPHMLEMPPILVH
jgi:protease-4